jgi:hypothetical protein
MENNYDMVNVVTSDIQKIIDNGAVKIKSKAAAYPKTRVEELENKLTTLSKWEECSASLEAVKNITQTFVDDYIQTNADFRYQSGMKQIVTRTASPGCCEWCSALAGVYEYGTEVTSGDDVFCRHNNCNCIVTFETAAGVGMENVHMKQSERYNRLSDIEATTGTQNDALHKLSQEQANAKEALVAQALRRRRQ